MFKKRIVFFVFLTIIAVNLVFSQSLSNSDTSSDTSAYDDYTIADRLKMGVFNMFFGLGSILQGRVDGYLITAIDVFGVILIIGGSNIKFGSGEKTLDLGTGRTDYSSYTDNKSSNGVWVIGVGIILGYIFPLFYHKPGAAKVSQDNFPFNIEFTAAKNGEIDGLKLCYNFKY